MGQLRIDFNALEWESIAQGARSKSYQQNGRKLRLLEFSKGFIEPDWCLKGHVGYVLEGEMDLDINGQVIHYSKGDGIFIPEGGEVKHKALVDKYIKLILVEDV